MENSKKIVSPPQFPWKKGHQEDYSCFSVEVQICQSVSGEVWSLHDFSTPEDGLTASKLHTEGQEQIVFGLFTEAIRREAFLEALIKESQKGDFLSRFSNIETREEAKKDLEETVLQVSQNWVEKLTKGAVEEILTMLTSQ